MRKTSHQNLTPWRPTPQELPAEWMNMVHRLLESSRGTLNHEFVLDAKYDGYRVDCCMSGGWIGPM
jgi:ATP-dependent DNA ligase